MRDKIWKIARQGLIIVVVIVFVTLGIDAIDQKDDLSRSIVGGLFKDLNKQCPDDMVFVGLAEGSFCLDRYEASASRACLYDDPANQTQSLANIDQPDCAAASEVEARPWRFISQNQAAAACRKAGKRLPTNKEWYEASVGMFDPNVDLEDVVPNCYLNNPNDQAPADTGSFDTCISPTGAYDLIGNVWEWVDGTVVDGVYKGRQLPPLGYVAGVDSEGMATATDPDEPDPNHNEDFFWIEPTQVKGMFRGGYWGNDSRAGIYGVNILVEPSFIGEGVGFRCAKNAG